MRANEIKCTNLLLHIAQQFLARLGLCHGRKHNELCWSDAVLEIDGDALTKEGNSGVGTSHRSWQGAAADTHSFLDGLDGDLGKAALQGESVRDVRGVLNDYIKPICYLTVNHHPFKVTVPCAFNVHNDSLLSPPEGKKMQGALTVKNVSVKKYNKKLFLECSLADYYSFR